MCIINTLNCAVKHLTCLVIFYSLSANGNASRNDPMKANFPPSPRHWLKTSCASICVPRQLRGTRHMKITHTNRTPIDLIPQHLKRRRRQCSQQNQTQLELCLCRPCVVLVVCQKRHIFRHNITFPSHPPANKPPPSIRQSLGGLRHCEWKINKLSVVLRQVHKTWSWGWIIATVLSCSKRLLLLHRMNKFVIAFVCFR